MASEKAVELFDPHLTERERQLLEQERIINADLDAKIISSHDKFPKAVWFIIPNEFGERFCYYGIKGLLNNYLKSGYGMSPEEAKTQIHIFQGLVYMCPLLGAALSDSFLGKYHTIVYLSTVYLFGNTLLSIFSINNLIAPFGQMPYWSFIVPALLVAIGSGGIKPCVSSHGGDQFLPTQTLLIDKFFSLFYVAVNCGALISIYLTPYLKKYVSCFGSECYFLAYGIPTITFAIVLVLFIFGFRYYRIVPPQGEFLPWKAAKVTFLAWKKNLNATQAEKAAKGHWLKFAEEDYGAEFVEETRLLGKVIIMFIPIIFFWVLYEQNGSEWQNQYEKMNQKFLGFIDMPTEASSNINSILIIILVPLLSFYVYPFLEKRGIRMPLMRRMMCGYFIVILAYLVSVSVEYAVNANAGSQVLKNGVAVSCEHCLNGTWQLPQWFLLSLGEAMISPTGTQFAYMQVGRQMKASSTSLWYLTSAIGNYIIAGMESSMHSIDDSPTRQWIYIAVSSISFICYSFLATRWFVSKEDEQAAKELEVATATEFKSEVAL